MSQQDQSPAGLAIKISLQSSGGADLQVSGTKEAVKGLFLLCPPSISPFTTMVSFHSHDSRTGRFYLFFPSTAPFPTTVSLTGATCPAVHSGGDWAMFRHDSQFTGIQQC